MNQVTINSQSFAGRSIIINNGKVIVDGKDVTPDSKEINITVHGNLENLSVDFCKNIDISGNVTKLSSGSGDIRCGDVTNGIKVGSGDIKCGNINGDVQTGSGDVTAENITGSVKTGSGDINYHR